jgi:hypothetical protein
VITPLPPVSKVLDETVQTLRKSGLEVIEIDAPAFNKCQSLANKFFGIDGGNHMFDLLEATQEPLTAWLSTRLRRGKPISLDRLVEIHAQKVELETEMLKIWKDPKTGRQIDAFICPVAPHPVPPIDRWNGVNYTSSFVLLDYPAGALPVRDFKEEDLKGELSDSNPLGSWDKINRELCKSLSTRVTFNSKANDVQGTRRPSIGRYTWTRNYRCKSWHQNCKNEDYIKRCLSSRAHFERGW